MSDSARQWPVQHGFILAVAPESHDTLHGLGLKTSVYEASLDDTRIHLKPCMFYSQEIHTLLTAAECLHVTLDNEVTPTFLDIDYEHSVREIGFAPNLGYFGFELLNFAQKVNKFARPPLFLCPTQTEARSWVVSIKTRIDALQHTRNQVFTSPSSHSQSLLTSFPIKSQQIQTPTVSSISSNLRGQREKKQSSSVAISSYPRDQDTLHPETPSSQKLFKRSSFRKASSYFPAAPRGVSKNHNRKRAPSMHENQENHIVNLAGARGIPHVGTANGVDVIHNPDQDATSVTFFVPSSEHEGSSSVHNAPSQSHCGDELQIFTKLQPPPPQESFHLQKPHRQEYFLPPGHPVPAISQTHSDGVMCLFNEPTQRMGPPTQLYPTSSPEKALPETNMLAIPQSSGDENFHDEFSPSPQFQDDSFLDKDQTPDTSLVSSHGSVPEYTKSPWTSEAPQRTTNDHWHPHPWGKEMQENILSDQPEGMQNWSQKTSDETPTPQLNPYQQQETQAPSVAQGARIRPAFQREQPIPSTQSISPGWTSENRISPYSSPYIQMGDSPSKSNGLPNNQSLHSGRLTPSRPLPPPTPIMIQDVNYSKIPRKPLRNKPSFVLKNFLKKGKDAFSKFKRKESEFFEGSPFDAYHYATKKETLDAEPRQLIEPNTGLGIHTQHNALSQNGDISASSGSHEGVTHVANFGDMARVQSSGPLQSSDVSGIYAVPNPPTQERNPKFPASEGHAATTFNTPHVNAHTQFLAPSYAPEDAASRSQMRLPATMSAQTSSDQVTRGEITSYQRPPRQESLSGKSLPHESSKTDPHFVAGDVLISPSPQTQDASLSTSYPNSEAREIRPEHEQSLQNVPGNRWANPQPTSHQNILPGQVYVTNSAGQLVPLTLTAEQIAALSGAAQ